MDLEVQDGEFLVSLQASGSGKTTALRMIAGLETVSSGCIRIGDRDVTNVLPKYRDIAMVFQSYALCPHLTVFANIAYPLTVRGQPKAEVEAAVKDVDGGTITVKADKFFDRRDGAPIGVDFADASVHVFGKDRRPRPLI
jgi:ABC-type sugar transport system ATPase subunit